MKKVVNKGMTKGSIMVLLTASMTGLSGEVFYIVGNKVSVRFECVMYFSMLDGPRVVPKH